MSIKFHRKGGFGAGSAVTRSHAKTRRAWQFGAMLTMGAVGIGLTGALPAHAAPTVGNFAGARVAATSDGVAGEAQFMATSPGGVVFHTIRYANGSWHSWGTPAASPANVVAVAAAADGIPGETQFLAVTSSGHIYHTVRYASGSWHSWGTPAGTPASVTAVAATGDGIRGETQFAVVTSAGSVYHTLRYANGSWQSFWGGLVVPAPMRTIAAASDGVAGEAQYLAASTGGTVFHTVRHANGTWQSSWMTPPASPSQVTSVAGTGDGTPGEAQFMAVTSAGSVFHTVRYANGGWQTTWGNPPGTAVPPPTNPHISATDQETPITICEPSLPPVCTTAGYTENLVVSGSGFGYFGQVRLTVKDALTNVIESSTSLQADASGNFSYTESFGGCSPDGRDVQAVAQPSNVNSNLLTISPCGYL